MIDMNFTSYLNMIVLSLLKPVSNIGSQSRPGIISLGIV